MQVHNLLPHLLEALAQWQNPPKKKQFAGFFAPMSRLLAPMLEDFGWHGRDGLYEVIKGLDWVAYRKETLKLDPVAEESRVRRIIDQVERCLGLTLQGDVILFGAFTLMDGYARFDQGRHRVYLGVDESHGRGAYLDILIAHELAHVAREPIPEIWSGFNLTPRMSHDDFVKLLPVAEHLLSEGFSCVLSELLNPREPVWHYVYQTEDTLARILEHGPAVDRVVHAHLRDRDASYDSLYDTGNYLPELPPYAHYVWAWLWASHLLRDLASNNPRQLLRLPAHDLVDDALSFTLPRMREISSS